MTSAPWTTPSRRICESERMSIRIAPERTASSAAAGPSRSRPRRASARSSSIVVRGMLRNATPGSSLTVAVRALRPQLDPLGDTAERAAQSWPAPVQRRQAKLGSDIYDQGSARSQLVSRRARRIDGSPGTIARSSTSSVDPCQRERYGSTLRSAVNPGGKVIIGAFAADGPTTCSGLSVVRYGAERLATALGEGFEMLAARREEHRTPGDSIQPFTWVALERTR